MYASNKDTAGTQAVRRLNPKGEDVIRMGQTKNLGGDMQISGTSQYAGASTIVDVVYREKGIYSLLELQARPHYHLRPRREPALYLRRPRHAGGHDGSACRH